MSHRNTLEARISEFRGICTSGDPAELPPYLGADCLDLDFSGETARRRLTKERYNGSALASPIDGIAAWYADTTNRLFLVAAGAKVYADRGTDNTFAVGDEIATGLTGGSAMDFWFWRDGSIYFGNGVDAVRKSAGGSASAVVAPITAPVSAMGLAPSILQAETFDATAWTSTNGALTSGYDATIRREGSNCLKLTMTGAGALNAFVYRALSAGATVDLSDAKELVLWVYGTVPGTQFQVGIYDDTESTLSSGPTWGRFPTWTIREANTWTLLRIPLGDIKPANRDAVLGMAIKIISDGGRAWTPNPLLYFDDCRVQGNLEADRYWYYYTYATVDAAGNVLRESAPSPLAQLDLSIDAPFRGALMSPTGSLDGTVNQLRMYRKRTNGFWARPKLVRTAENATPIPGYVDAKDDSQVDLDPASVELQFFRDAPPKAYTYCLSNKRLLAGDVTVSGTRYRTRVYLSAYNDPEAFSASEHTNISDPNAAGWFDLPDGHNIRRIVDVEGQAIIFTDRSIWSLLGDGWDNFIVRKRADVGLDSRWGVAAMGRLLAFIAGDGIRVVAPNRSFDQDFETWRIDEPVQDLVRAIPTSAFNGRRRQKVALGVDERGRLHVSYSATAGAYNNAGLIFDPALHPDCLSRNPSPHRPGWMRYSAWNFSQFFTLQYGVNDQGQMIAAEDGANYLCWIHKKYASATGGSTNIEDATLQWSYTGPAFDAGQGGLIEPVHVAADLIFVVGGNDPVTALGAAVLDRGRATVPSGGGALSMTDPRRGALARVGPNPCRWLQPQVYSDGTKNATGFYAVATGYYKRR